MNENKRLLQMEKFFTALADTTRLRLLNLIRDEEVCVCFFVEALSESQPKISRHLAYLRKAGLVSARRDGKWMHYRIVPPENPQLRKILENALESLKLQNETQQEHEKLVEACCSVKVPTTIARAPKPETFEQADISLRETELETHLL